MPCLRAISTGSPTRWACSPTSQGARLAAPARQLAIDRYSWLDIGRRAGGIRRGARHRLPLDRPATWPCRRPMWIGGRRSATAARRRRRAALVARPRLERRLPPSTSSTGRGSFALELNLVSVLLRSVAWQLTINQALRPQPRFDKVFSASRSACSRTPCCRGGSAKRARGSASAPRATGPGSSGALVGTVFAHRLFDLFPTPCS